LPDLVFGKTSDQDIMMDLNPLIKQYNFDKSRVKPVLWETYSYLTDTDQKTLFIPLATNMHLLHYNKGIFDRFGVPYPKDGMTWDQTYELARKLARTENGVKYLGFNIRANLNLSGTQLLLPYYDSKSDKAVMNTDGWKRYFANFSRFFEIAGNEVTKAGNELANDDLFLKKQTVAMYAAHPLFSVLADLPATGSDLNWDIVSLPNFPEAPRQGTSANTNGLGITISSKHKDDAFLVIQTLLSDEVQLANARTGYESVLVKDEQQQKEFGKEYSVLNGKNIPAIFYNKYAPTPQFNDYNSRIKNTPYNHFRRVVWGEAGINTALRDAEEEMNKLIEQVKLEKKK
jgi:multiple sugar transport system substrate-binding protein